MFFPSSSKRRHVCRCFSILLVAAFSSEHCCTSYGPRTSSATATATASARCCRGQDETSRTRIHPLFMKSDDHPITAFPAQDALKSSTMARTIRKYRSSQSYRRKTSTDTRPRVTVERETSATNSSVSSVRLEPQIAKHQYEQQINPMDLPYDSALQTLQAYHSVHGDLVIPRRYVVPNQAPFPPDWHGADLARTVYDMEWWQRHVKSKPSRVAELNRLGFVWERLQPEWNLVLEALITYSTLHGHVMVPHKFVVPVGEAHADNGDHSSSNNNETKNPWPRATWGIPLGSCVSRIRARNDFLRGPHGASRRDQLDGLGFVWDVQEHLFQMFYKCLYRYAQLNKSGPFSPAGEQQTGALKVPASFVVPRDDPRWSRDLWEYPLGVKCHAVRQKELYVKNNRLRQQLLEELGFRWSGNAYLGWLQVVHAAAIYSQMHNRRLDVPYHFVVPSAPPLQEDPSTEDWPWPEYLWGLPLGQRLKDVRLKGLYLKGKDGSSRRRQLETLGFIWKPKRGRRKKQSADPSTSRLESL